MTDNVVTGPPIEPLVREAYAAAIARDPGRSAEALAAMGEQHIDQSMILATMVNAYALHMVLGSSAGNSANNLAGEFVETEGWAELQRRDVYEYVKRLSEGGDDRQGQDHGIDPAVLTRLTFVLGAHLMSAYDFTDQPWYKLYDAILDKIEEDNKAR